MKMQLGGMLHITPTSVLGDIFITAKVGPAPSGVINPSGDWQSHVYAQRMVGVFVEIIGFVLLARECLFSTNHEQ